MSDLQRFTVNLFPSPLCFPQRLTLAMQDSMALANESANEVVSGIRVVRSFNTEKHEICRYGDRLMVTHTIKTRRDTVRAVYLLARRVRCLSFVSFREQGVFVQIVVYCRIQQHWCVCLYS